MSNLKKKQKDLKDDIANWIGSMDEKDNINQ
jgi:hypothetical protein